MKIISFEDRVKADASADSLLDEVNDEGNRKWFAKGYEQGVADVESGDVVAATETSLREAMTNAERHVDFARSRPNESPNITKEAGMDTAQPASIEVVDVTPATSHADRQAKCVEMILKVSVDALKDVETNLAAIVEVEAGE